ncbi:hypothetical protein Tco_0851776 [Tanacetum coccineum]
MEVLIKTCLMPLAIKTQNDSFTFVHELKQEIHAGLKYVESLKNEIDKLESDKAEFSNMYDILLQECVSNDVICSYLHSLSNLDAHSELQCLYIHKVKECEYLAQKLSKQTESVSKEVYTELLRSFTKLEKHSISLELTLQQCQEQMKDDTGGLVNTGGLGFSTGSGPVSSDRGQREGKAQMIVEETQAPKRTKEQIQQEEASLVEAIRLQNLEEEETAKQVHLDALLAKRLAEEEELTEQQKQRKAQV